ncbi:transmembrane protein 134-like [Panonychus citri]|uniref:transmembrane protein 134-like n=1 Tax=Panonychus citri TaxID=50023 RepID=UPI002307FBAD|nr:transmembrane protein 134-like [Panonychus citri]
MVNIPPVLEVTDNLTITSNQESSSTVAVDGKNKATIKSDENSLDCDSGVVINNIIIGDGQQISSFPITSPPHLNLPATSFWTPGLSPVDDDIVNYGSCDMNNSVNRDEVDQIKQTFLNGGSNKLNKDIESLCTGQSNYYPVDRNNSKIRWWKHPKFKENWKIFFAAFGLLVVGIGLITMGIVVSVLPDVDFQSYVFFIAGTICFIPGAYHVVYLYFALSGRKGYDFHQLPLFN